jgi:hypothetical protein
MAKTQFVVRKEDVVAIYSDRDRAMLDKLGEVEYERASHVDPITPPCWYEWLQFWNIRTSVRRYIFCVEKGAGHFGIFWKGSVRRWSPTFSDDSGRPFTEKGQAVLYEVARLERDYLKTRTEGLLFLEDLHTPEKESKLP